MRSQVNHFWLILAIVLLIPAVSSVTLTPELIDHAEIQAFKATVCQVDLPETDCVSGEAEIYYGVAKLYQDFISTYISLSEDAAQTALQNCEIAYGADRCTLITEMPYQKPRLYIRFPHEPMVSEVIGFLILDEDGEEKIYRSTGGGPGVLTTRPLTYTQYSCSLNDALEPVCTSSQKTGSQPDEVILGNRDTGNQLFEDGTENQDNQFVLDLIFPNEQAKSFARLNIDTDASYLSFFTLPAKGDYSSIWYGDVGVPTQLGYYGPPAAEGLPPFYPMPNLRTYKLISIEDIRTFEWEPEE